jgi:hypothetical protein
MRFGVGVVLLAGVTIIVAICASPLQRSRGAAIVIANATILDPQSPLDGMRVTVTIRGERIASVAATSETPPAGTRVVDGAGKYLIPGLWDMHVHLTEVTQASLPVFVANGVTGVRDMGSAFDDILRWRASIANDALVGPRIIAAGPKLDGSGEATADTWIVRTPDDARAAVDRLAAMHVDFIKAHAGLDGPRFLAIMRAARAHGLAVAGHLPANVSVPDAARAGLASLEHFSGFPIPCSDDLTSMLEGTRWQAMRERCASSSVVQEVLATVRDAETWLTPTLVSFRGLSEVLDPNSASASRPDSVVTAVRASWNRTAEQIRQDVQATPRDRIVWRRWLSMNAPLTAMAVNAGVRLLAGTDAGNPYVAPGFDLLDELVLMTDAGLTPAEALRSATIGPLQFLHEAKDEGIIAVGRRADLVLLDANPIVDIQNVRRIHAVVANGRLYDRTTLDRLLAAAGVHRE